MADTRPPSRPKDLRLIVDSLFAARLRCKPSFDAYGVEHYRWFCNGERVADTKGSVLALVHIPGAEARWTVAAVDAAGNVSQRARAINVKAYGILAIPGQPSDTSPPTVPQNVVATVLSATSVRLDWPPSSDNVGVAGYQVYRGGVPLNTTVAPSYIVNDLTPNTAYQFTVSAYDAAGNASSQSLPVSVTTATVSGPVWTNPGTIPLTIGVSYSLALDSICTDIDSLSITYTRLGGTDIPWPGGVFSAAQKRIDGVPTTVGTYLYAIRASDGFNTSDITLVFEVLNADTTAPSVPTGLTATAISSSQITVAWGASTDPTVVDARTSGVSTYSLYRDGSLRATGPNTSYPDTGLAANTSYSYTVLARDAAGNESAQSAQAQATTQGDMSTAPTKVVYNDAQLTGGGTHTTIAAAMAAAVPGDIIELRNRSANATWDQVIVSQVAGTQAQPIMLRGRVGDGVTIVGFAGNLGGSGRVASVYMGHAWLDWGAGIEVRGTNTGTTASFTAANPDHLVRVQANNCTGRFTLRGGKNSGYDIATGVTDWLIYQSDVATVGSLNRGDGKDAGEGHRVPEKQAGGPVLVLDSRFAMGGHQAFQTRTDPALIRYLLVDQSGWEALSFGGVTGLRARAAAFHNGFTRTVIERTMVLRCGRNVDSNAGPPNLRIENENVLMRECLCADNNDGPLLVFLAPPLSQSIENEPGANDIRVAHSTFYLSTAAPAIAAIDNLGPNWGPFRFKNILLASIQQGTGDNSAVDLQYRSTRTPNWRTIWFFDGVQADFNYPVRIRDLDNIVATVQSTLNDLEVSESANFKNIYAGSAYAPAFVSTALPAASLRGLAAWTVAATNFVPQTSVAGVALTTLTSAVSNTVLPVADAKWFRDQMGWGTRAGIVGDTIYVAGFGEAVILSITGNNITVDRTVTAAIGASVFRGSTDSPRMGCVL